MRGFGASVAGSGFGHGERLGGRGLRGLFASYRLAADRRRDAASGGCVWPRLRDEQRLAVVAQLFDALPDVGERPVPALLGRAGEIDPWVPAPGELLDARYVDHAVVQVVIELRQVARDETAVGRDRVPAQGRLAHIRHT